MAEKTTTATKKAETEEKPQPSERDKRVARGQCVVDEPFHVGRAVNGLVCSYHAMHYAADGTPRG